MTKTHPTFRTSWNGLNALPTPDIELRRGETVLIEGLTYTYKSGLLLDLYIALCTLHVPEETSRKPTILLINGETTPSAWLNRIYNTLKLEETGGEVPVDQPTDVDRIDYVSTRLQANGWTVSMLNMPIGKWSAQDFCDYLDEYAAFGHDIQAVFMDGLEALAYTPNEDLYGLKDLETLHAHMAARHILFVATRQLPLSTMQAKHSGVDKEALLNEAFDSTRATVGTIADAELMVDTTQGDENYDVLIGYGSHRHNVKPTYKRLSFYEGTTYIKK